VRAPTGVRGDKLCRRNTRSHIPKTQIYEGGRTRVMEFLTNFALQWKQSDDKQTLHDKRKNFSHTVPFHVKILSAAAKVYVSISAER